MERFHVHVDASSLPEELATHLRQVLGFVDTNFSGHPEGVEHYEPAAHLTLKMSGGSAFRQAFEATTAAARAGALDGYVEGEVIALDEAIEENPFDSTIPVPFRIQTRKLPPDTFRESEIHVTMDRDRSDPRLLKSLIEMGFFAAYLPKSWGTAIIFTAQGSRDVIRILTENTLAYLRTAGGAIGCTVKEERIAAWWTSRSDVPLPPVVERVA